MNYGGGFKELRFAKFSPTEKIGRPFIKIEEKDLFGSALENRKQPEKLRLNLSKIRESISRLSRSDCEDTGRDHLT
jgi:hypothetical protein